MKQYLPELNFIMKKLKMELEKKISLQKGLGKHIQ